MSFLTVKDGIVNILRTLTYQEAESVDIENVSTNEYDNTFILKCISGEQTDPSSDLSDHLLDAQVWTVTFMFAKSEQNDKINMDEIHAAKDNIIKELDDPVNWRSFVRFLKYKSWILEETPNYYLLTVTLSVTDTYTY
jgi:hypothetical protein